MSREGEMGIFRVGRRRVRVDPGSSDLGTAPYPLFPKLPHLFSLFKLVPAKWLA